MVVIIWNLLLMVEDNTSVMAMLIHFGNSTDHTHWSSWNGHVVYVVYVKLDLNSTPQV
jgi:hypothetical protein